MPELTDSEKFLLEVLEGKLQEARDEADFAEKNAARNQGLVDNIEFYRRQVQVHQAEVSEALARIAHIQKAINELNNR